VAAGLEAVRRAVRLTFRERFAAGHMARPLAIVIRVLGAFGQAKGLDTTSAVLFPGVAGFRIVK
jgi:hypothetical protein